MGVGLPSPLFDFDGLVLGAGDRVLTGTADQHSCNRVTLMTYSHPQSTVTGIFR